VSRKLSSVIAWSITGDGPPKWPCGNDKAYRFVSKQPSSGRRRIKQNWGIRLACIVNQRQPLTMRQHQTFATLWSAITLRNSMD
jgi:hypothetical protein